MRNIQNRDVDLGARQIVYRHTKNGKVQVVPLCSQMVSILREYMTIRKGEPAEYLFCNQYGEMLSENALRFAIAHYNRSRGVEKTSIHLFRHTFARKYLVDCGGGAFMLQKLLGHSTLAMTKHYCAIYDADISKNYDRFSPLAQLQQAKSKLRRAWQSIKPWFFRYPLTFLVWIDLEGLVRANKAVWKNFHWGIFCRRRAEKRAYPEIFRFYYNCRMAGDRFFAADRSEPQ